MEIFMRNLSYSATKEDVIVGIAKILHHGDYRELWGSFPVNLEVHIHVKNKRPGAAHKGTGTFTVAVESVARRFLQEYGGQLPLKPFYCGGRVILFQQSRNRPAMVILHQLEHTPYVDP